MGMITISTRDPNLNLENCKKTDSPCELTLSKDPPITKEATKELYKKCCANQRCEPPTGVPQEKNLVVNLYIKNSKLRTGAKRKGCEGDPTDKFTTPEDCSELKNAGKFKNLELVIDFSGENRDLKKDDVGTKYQSGCQDETKPVGKPRTTGRNNKPVQKKSNFPLKISLPEIPIPPKLDYRNWNTPTSQDIVLGKGEVGIDKSWDPPRQKIGDGITAWKDLDYSFNNPQGCPLVLPLLNISIPTKQSCASQELRNKFRGFLKDCNDTIDPKASIPGVCGPEVEGFGGKKIKCDWTHLYNPNPPEEAKSYYNNDGTLKDQYMKPGYGRAFNGLACQDRAEGLKSGGVSGPTYTDGSPLFDSECLDVFGYIPPTKDSLGGIKCPSEDMLNMCDTLACIDDTFDDLYMGTDEDGNSFPVNGSNISVTIVNKDGDIASNCLDGSNEEAMAFTYFTKDDPNGIYIDIHMGESCDDNVTVDRDAFFGTTVCRAKTASCDTGIIGCITGSFDSTDCGNPNYTSIQKFECLASDSQAVKDLLASDVCNSSPQAYCCYEIPILPNTLEIKPLKDCCGKDNYRFLGLVDNTSEDEAKRECNPKVACCMLPPANHEGTCVYSKPTKVISKIEVRYYFSGTLNYLSGGPTNLDRSFTGMNTNSEYIQMTETLRNNKMIRHMINAEFDLGYRISKDRAPNIDNWGPSDFNAVWNTSIIYAVNSGLIKVVTEEYNFEIIKIYDVANCDNETILQTIADPANAIKLNTQDIINKSSIKNGDKIGSFNNNLDKLLSLSKIASKFTNTPNSTEFIANKTIHKKLSCITQGWVLETARTTSAEACAAMYKNIATCCEGGGGHRFFPDVVNVDLTTSPAKNNCAADPETGSLTCQDTPQEEDNPCYIVSDSDFKASYSCTEKLNGRVVATESKTVTLTKCPDFVDCNNNPPDNPPDVPDPEDPDNPLDPPDVPDTPEPPKEPPPPPKKDDPPKPPKRPPVPPEVRNCTNKKEELQKAQKQLAYFQQELQIVGPQLAEFRQANLVHQQEYTDNIYCNNWFISFLTTFGLTNVALGIGFWQNPPTWATNSDDADCLTKLSNIAITWDGEIPLPDSIAPYVNEPNPRLAKLADREEYANEQINILNNTINELQNYINNNCS